MSVANECPVPKCSASKEPFHAMCRPHWFKVPKDIQRRIIAAWRVRNMPEWTEAMEEAKASILLKERT